MDRGSLTEEDINKLIKYFKDYDEHKSKSLESDKLKSSKKCTDSEDQSCNKIT